MSLLALLAVLILTPITSGQSDSCRTCNCQFNNIEVLDQLIEYRIRSILANDTVSTQALESRVSNTVALNFGKLVP